MNHFEVMFLGVGFLGDGRQQAVVVMLVAW
jgi:hypothetical protein